MSALQLSPTHELIIRLLSDGMPHQLDELYQTMDDAGFSRGALRVQLMTLRKKLRERGEDIERSAAFGRTWYRHIRLHGSHYAGRI